jgi:GTPase SAR1 family protein
MTHTRNILLIGKTGSGKSTLANVLINKNNQFEEVFKEGKYGVSQTKKVHAEEFEYEGIKYKIIDTVGVSDTGGEISLNKVLYNLAKVGYVVKNGLSQIWLVTDGKSAAEQTNSLYNLLKETIFDENIANYTTIVRTRFDSFEEEDECSEDRNIMLENSGELKEVVEKGINKVIHVDNPPLSGRSVEANKKTREESRKILSKCLTAYKSIYKPANLDKLNKIIAKE